MKKAFIDTNILMQYGDEIFNDYDKVIIHITTLEELDHINHNSENETKKYRARKGIKAIEKYLNNEKLEIIIKEPEFELPTVFDKLKNDHRILATVKDLSLKDNEIIFITDDLNLLLKAKGIDIPCKKFKQSEDTLMYKGYKCITGNASTIIDLNNELYEGLNKYGFVQNEYLIFYNENIDEVSEFRFDNGKFVDLKLPPSKVIKGMNSLQRCALDLLNNKDITICTINGTVGSGKTYSALRMALYHVLDKGNQSKILAVREATGEGKQVGYLKGTFEDKTTMFFKPIEQCLDGGEFELQSLIQKGIFDSNIPFYLKGTTFDSTIMVVDEAEDLNEKQLKLVGTRMGRNSRIFFSGDYKQSVYDDSEHNALVRMCNELKGNKNFGCIYLDDDVRSTTSKIFADLFVR